MGLHIDISENNPTEIAQNDPIRFVDVAKILKSGHARNFALDKVYLSIKERESLSTVGESRSGESTLGLVVVNLLRINSRNVLLQRKDISWLRGASLRTFRKNTQMLFQDTYSSLNHYNTIYQSVIAPANANRQYYETLTGEMANSRSQLRDRVAEMLDLVGRTLGQNFPDICTKELSGGQRQRVTPARSLILRSRLIVADDPTSMLDVPFSAQVLNLLTKLNEDFKFSVMFMSHGLFTTKYISGKIALTNLGRVVEYGSSGEITENPMHHYTDILIKLMLDVGGFKTKEQLAKIDFGQYNGGVTGCSFAHSCSFVTYRCPKERLQPGKKDNDHWIACFYLLGR